MRIVHAVDNYPPVPGGMEQAVQALAVAQAAAGHEVVVVSLAGPGMPAVDERDGVRLERVDTRLGRGLRRLAADPTHQFHPTVPDPGVVAHLDGLLDRLRPEVLHAHGWIVSSATATHRPRGTLLAHTLHDYGLTCATKTFMPRQELDVTCPGPSLARCLPCSAGFYGWPKGVLLTVGLLGRPGSRRRIDLHLPISEAVARACLSDVPSERVRVLPSFVPDAVLVEARSPLPRPDWVPPGDHLLFVGQLGEHKGVGALAAAHARMRHRVPLVLVGGSRPDTPPLEGTPGRPVHVVGPRGPAEVLAAQQAATIAVVPSRWAEPLGLVAVEALAAGTPVVASDVGGLPDVVGPECGVLVPPGDVAALAAALDELLDDPVRRARLGAAGPSRAARFSASAVVPRIEEAYAEAHGRLAATAP